MTAEATRRRRRGRRTCGNVIVPDTRVELEVVLAISRAHGRRSAEQASLSVVAPHGVSVREFALGTLDDASTWQDFPRTEPAIYCTDQSMSYGSADAVPSLRRGPAIDSGGSPCDRAKSLAQLTAMHSSSPLDSRVSAFPRPEAGARSAPFSKDSQLSLRFEKYRRARKNAETKLGSGTTTSRPQHRSRHAGTLLRADHQCDRSRRPASAFVPDPIPSAQTMISKGARPGAAFESFPSERSGPPFLHATCRERALAYSRQRP